MLEQSLVQKGSGDYIPNDLELGKVLFPVTCTVYVKTWLTGVSRFS